MSSNVKEKHPLAGGEKGKSFPGQEPHETFDHCSSWNWGGLNVCWTQPNLCLIFLSKLLRCSEKPPQSTQRVKWVRLEHRSVQLQESFFVGWSVFLHRLTQHFCSHLPTAFWAKHGPLAHWHGPLGTHLYPFNLKRALLLTGPHSSTSNERYWVLELPTGFPHLTTASRNEQ